MHRREEVTCLDKQKSGALSLSLGNYVEKEQMNTKIEGVEQPLRRRSAPVIDRSIDFT